MSSSKQVQVRERVGQSERSWEQPIALALLGLGILARLLPHPPNFAPISAIALFGGVYLSQEYALFLPLLAMFASDMIGARLGLFPGFYHGQPLVYVAFASAGLTGLWIRQRKTVARIAAGALASSVVFFVITNFNPIHGGTIYPNTWQGLLESYVAAIPFFRNTLAGDLLYTAVLFGSYELVRAWIGRPSLAMRPLEPNTSRTKGI